MYIYISTSIEENGKMFDVEFTFERYHLGYNFEPQKRNININFKSI